MSRETDRYWQFTIEKNVFGKWLSTVNISRTIERAFTYSNIYIYIYIRVIQHGSGKRIIPSQPLVDAHGFSIVKIKSHLQQTQIGKGCHQATPRMFGQSSIYKWIQHFLVISPKDCEFVVVGIGPFCALLIRSLVVWRSGIALEGQKYGPIVADLDLVWFGITSCVFVFSSSVVPSHKIHDFERNSLEIKLISSWLLVDYPIGGSGSNIGNVKPGLINHGLLIRGYSPNSYDLILKWYLPT